MPLTPESTPVDKVAPTDDWALGAQHGKTVDQGSDDCTRRGGCTFSSSCTHEGRGRTLGFTSDAGSSMSVGVSVGIRVGEGVVVGLWRKADQRLLLAQDGSSELV